MKEADFVPYSAELLSGSRFCVLAPHPDDEIFGAGGTLHLLAGEGKKVFIHILTDGASQGNAATRREESKKACSFLGLEQVEFHDLPDRRLERHADQIMELLKRVLTEEQPDGILLPGPHEAHPDHRALARMVISFFHGLRPGDEIFASAKNLKLVFAEISLPQQINHLVDITSVADRKSEALGFFASQQDFRDYQTKMMGLNAYRSTTLPVGSTHAEGFRVISVMDLTCTPLSTYDPHGEAPLDNETDLSVSVILRTRNRPQMLAEALQSLRDQTFPAEQIVIVNDGGEDVQPVMKHYDDLPVSLIQLKSQQGRGTAANRGISKATGDSICFLDDDDLFFPEHLSVLTAALAHSPAGVVYSDAVSTIHAPGEDGRMEQTDRLLSYANDYDGDLLLYDNYIPFHTLLIRRDLLRQAGPIREDIDLFEDWEFLIRLSRITPFHHIRRVTCQYRHFSTGATLGSNPSLHPDFIRGRRKVLELTQSYRTSDVEERLLRRVRDELRRSRDKIFDLTGELRYHRNESVDRMREIHILGTDLGRVRDELSTVKSDSEKQIYNLESRVRELKNLLSEREEEISAASQNMEELQKHLTQTYKEIERLNGLLSQIYHSRTWKIHAIFQRLKGKG